MPKFVSGQYCSPHRSKQQGGQTCYTKKQLVDLAKQYNRKYSHTISTNLSKDELWNELHQRMTECNNEWCWSEKLEVDLNNDPSFRPPATEHFKNWLSTDDIRSVLVQYEHIDPSFAAIGPLPIDFCDLGHMLCNINLHNAYIKGTRTIGIVFNTDPSDQPGKHWISMFVDMRPNDPRLWEINYFDSFGNAPLAPEIIRLVKVLETQIANEIVKKHNVELTSVKVIKKLNCSNKICTSKARHQFNDSECGVYCIHFIVQRLMGVTWEELVQNHSSLLNDDHMIQMRNYYFRPN